MTQSYTIQRVAVLGAGVMGAQIAAHCINAGFQTRLFDLAANGKDKHAQVNLAIKNLLKLKPAPLGTQKNASLLEACNYDDDLAKLSECDLIIEAIAERQDLKESLYAKVSPFIKKSAIFASNTSGLSINGLAKILPESMRHQFCGIHFFNPPRYMHLAEIIPANETAPELLDFLETWLTRYLGKGVVRAKDTPNFIANRIGVFSLLATLYRTEQMNLSLDEVDALTGQLIGRPKSATFRTMDVVGLDTMKHVVHTMQSALKDDPWHAHFQLPKWLLALIDKGHLGQKSGAGIYRKNGKVIEVYDVKTGDYKPSKATVSDEIKAIMALKDPKDRMSALIASRHPQAKFLTACFLDLFHYSAYHLEGISNSVLDVDKAMSYGFGWNDGPFKQWQSADIKPITHAINHAIKDGSSMAKVELPSWVGDISAFYQDDKSWSASEQTFVSSSQLPVYQRQVVVAKDAKILFENDGLVAKMADNKAIIIFKSKSNTISQSVLDGLKRVLDIAEASCDGVILWQQNPLNFSSGADLSGVASLIQKGDFNAVDSMIEQFQTLAMRLKYLSIPTVAALRGRALGGGCELMLHCQSVVAAFESYPGLVELGVGVIPAGGGCKEMALRIFQNTPQKADILSTLEPVFSNIAMAKVAESAEQAREFGYLRAQDIVVMHEGEVLYTALKQVDMMNASNFRPPMPVMIPVAGREACARLRAGLVNWVQGGFISVYDARLAASLANVLCGGDLNEGTLVSEGWYLELERKTFVELVKQPETQARIKHLLETGKPLRN